MTKGEEGGIILLILTTRGFAFVTCSTLQSLLSTLSSILMLTQLENAETGAYEEPCEAGKYRPLEFLKGYETAEMVEGKRGAATA